MTIDDVALMMAVFGGTFVLCAAIGLRSGNAKRDVALMGGSGAFCGALAAFFFAA